MKLLLDTHVIIWALEDSQYLSPHIREMIMDDRNEIYVSVASLWEIAIKHKKAPSKIRFDTKTIADYSQKAGYIFLSLSVDNVTTFDRLDLSSHSDPFDQILVSQSVSNNMKLITHDQKIKNYGLGNVELF